MITAAASSSAFDQPGTLAFLVIFGMGVALYFVFRSMSKHLRKVNNAAAAAAPEQQRAGHPGGPGAGRGGDQTGA